MTDNGDTELHIEELFLLQRVAQKINSILDLSELLEEVVGDVAQTFGYSRTAVLLKDAESNELVIAAVRGWTTNFHVKGDRLKIGEYGIVGHVAAWGQTYYAPDVTVDPYYQVSEESTRSELDIPLKVRGETIGVFSFQHQETHRFPSARISILEALAGHVSTAIENAKLFQRERRERERMTRELEEARKVQASLFPRRAPELPGFEIVGQCRPCNEVGGDWFDYIPQPDGRWLLILADVAGKGMGAALLMASARSIVRQIATACIHPSDLLTGVNRVLIDDFPKTRFVTMISAMIDPSVRRIRFANACHLPPLLMSSQKTQFMKIDTGLPLGIKETAFPEYEVDMPPATNLLFYSDGVSEAMNASFEEYGTARILNHMKNLGASVESLLNDVRTFTGQRLASDDSTLLMIKAV
jgi:sigma-B regulation protein RsbU (phosphoserine phosphatase)